VKTYRKNDAVVIEMFGLRFGWEQWFLLMSDEHFDSTHCDRKLLKRHHDQALERNAKILKFGDLFDCMGGKYDPRSHKGMIRPEYQTARYFDDVVEDAVKFYTPYKDNILFVGDGNHELSIQMRHEFSMLDRFAMQLNPEVILRGKYAGFIRFKFNAHGSGRRSSKVMYYTHGTGGSAPVTKGVIQTARRQETFLADYYVSGHTHNEWDMPRMQTRLNEQNNIRKDRVHHWSLGTYKDDHLEGGWVDLKGFPAPSMGGRWLRFYYGDTGVKLETTMTDL
jgi:hypothetical protein